MAFTDMLLNSMLGSSSIEAMSKKSGASSAQVENVVSAALPLLMQKMQENASTEEGAASLSAALKAHAADDATDAASFIERSDGMDGAKIIKHILGEDTGKVQKSISRSTGLKSSQVSSILTSVAPLLLTMVGGQTQQQNTQSNQLGSLLGGILGGGSASSGMGSGLLGALLGGGSQSGTGSLLTSMLGGNSQSSSGGLLTNMLGGSQNSSTSSLGSSLLSGLLSSVADTPEPEEEEDDGMDLLSMLLGGQTPAPSTQNNQKPGQSNSILSLLGKLFK